MERLTNFWGSLTKCESCSENSNCYSHSCNHISESIAKLRDYEDLEEQGILLKLVGKYQKIMIGQEAWIVTVNNKIKFGRISIIKESWDDYNGFRGEYALCPDKGLGCWNFKFADFGKTVFFSQEEAESELRRRERDKRNDKQ